MSNASIPGYRLHDQSLARSPITVADLATLQASLLFGPDDIVALRKAHAVVAGQVEDILDVWYGFVGSNPHLLESFVDRRSGAPDSNYLAAVRKRFGKWILDTCLADYDGQWLAYQDEIGRRHHRTGKNATDGASAVPHIQLRYILALVMPISVTMKPFFAKTGLGAAEVDAMHAAWTKSVLLQAILWSRPYVKDGDF